MSTKTTHPRITNLAEAIALIIFLIIAISSAVFFFSGDATSGPIQLALFSTAFASILIGLKNGYAWKEIEESISNSIGMAANAIAILFAVGTLIGTWILCGTVPSMVYYGLMLLSPEIFYPSAAIICALVSLSIGSSWTTIATVGVALLGISHALDMSTAITVGAIVSGAYFGDKMSPLSDTTNLAPAVSGSEIFSHIRHMTWVSIPSFLIAVILYAIIGFASDHNATETSNLTVFTDTLNTQFSIGPHLLLPLIILLFMAVKKVPALLAILIGALLGALFAVLFQIDNVLHFFGDSSPNSFAAAVKGIMLVMFNGYTSNSGHEAVDSLLSKGGMSSMTTTVWLVLSAMIMAGVLERIGVLTRMVQALVHVTKGTGSLISATLANSFLMNVLTGEQYISIVLPGQMWREEYKRRKLAAVNLSRCLEDAGTLTSPLVPWTSCGAYIYGVLSLTNFAYIPFCFFNILNPIVSAIYGYLGFTILPLEEKEDKNLKATLPKNTQPSTTD